MALYSGNGQKVNYPIIAKFFYCAEERDSRFALWNLSLSLSFDVSLCHFEIII